MQPRSCGSQTDVSWRAGASAEVLSPPVEEMSEDRFEALSMITATFAREIPEFGVTILAHPAGEIVVPGRVDAKSSEVHIAVRATNVTLALGKPDQSSVRTILGPRGPHQMRARAPLHWWKWISKAEAVSSPLRPVWRSPISLYKVGSSIFALIKAGVARSAWDPLDCIRD